MRATGPDNGERQHRARRKEVITPPVALLRPVSCGARRAWLVKEVGARANRTIDRHERDRFISYINTQLGEQVWKLTDDYQRDPNPYDDQHTDLQALFGSAPDDF